MAGKLVEMFGQKVKGKNGDVNVCDLCGDNKIIGKNTQTDSLSTILCY